MVDANRVDYHTGQFPLNDRPSLELGSFLEALHSADLMGAHKWFDKLDGASVARQSDPKMNLETFKCAMSDSLFVMLQIGSPVPEQIRFCISGDIMRDGSTRFAWVEAPLNPRNYSLVERAFRETFQAELSEQ